MCDKRTFLRSILCGGRPNGWPKKNQKKNGGKGSEKMRHVLPQQLKNCHCRLPFAICHISHIKIIVFTLFNAIECGIKTDSPSHHRPHRTTALMWAYLQDTQAKWVYLLLCSLFGAFVCLKCQNVLEIDCKFDECVCVPDTPLPFRFQQVSLVWHPFSVPRNVSCWFYLSWQVAGILIETLCWLHNVSEFWFAISKAWMEL